jgi:cyclic pyranopterin phosphate synthase
MLKKTIPIVAASKASFLKQENDSTHFTDLVSFIDWEHPNKDNKNTLDVFNRELTDLRISVTDRCNFRCNYCMPKEIFDKNYQYSPQHELLSFEEIFRLAKIFVSRGVKKIRLTGGEPLLRKNLEALIKMLSQLRTPDNHAIDLSLTTNGSVLARKAHALKEAGLNRLTVSLDALNDDVFQKMNDVAFPVREVLDGIEEARKAGFENIKINMVVKKGVNDQEILPMVKYFKNTPHVLRFIEYMDVGSTNQWQRNEVVSSEVILHNLAQENFHFKPLSSHYASETAERWQHIDGQGEIGFISSVSKAFCSKCTRARLSTQGMLYTCLFASAGHDFKSLLRNTERTLTDQEISNVIASIWHHRDDRYSLLRNEHNEQSKLDTNQTKKIEMSYIGG